MHIWTPRYAAPNRPLGIIPPSPPAEQRQKRRRAWQKEFRSYTGRVICPGSEQYEEAMAYLACPMPLTGVGGPAVSGGGGGTSLPTTNLIAQWKADSEVYNDAGTTLATNTQTVQQWNDQSGAGLNLAQATSGSRPQFLTAQQNGLPAVKFSGAKSISVTLTTASLLTVFFVYISNTAGTNQVQFAGKSAPAGGFPQIIQAASPSLTIQNNGNNFVTGAATSIWAIGCLACGNSASSFWRLNANVSESIANSATANAWTGISLGTTGTAQWSFGEVLVYSGILSTTNETAVRNYLNARWAIF